MRTHPARIGIRLLALPLLLPATARAKIAAVSLLMLQAVGLILLPASRASALAMVTGGSGSVSTRSHITGESSDVCVCPPDERSIEFPPNADKPTSDNLSCPSCQHTFVNGGQSATVSVGATHVSASYSGGSHFVAFTTTCSGDADSIVGVPLGLPESQCDSVGSIGFAVSGQPEFVDISVSIQITGADGTASAQILRDATGVPIVTITADQSGTHGSIAGGVFDPGQYTLSAVVQAGSEAGSSFSYTLTMSVSAGTLPNTEFHWINPASGDFGVASNWNPQQVPMSSDTAIFDLTGSGSIVPIRAMDNQVGRWIIRHMGVGLIGSAEVVGTGTDPFVVDDGGFLVLQQAEGGTSFSTNGGVVGDQIGDESRVLIGPSSNWHVLGPLAIARRALGKVTVDENALLEVQQGLTVGNVLSTGGTLQVEGTLRVESGGTVNTSDLTLNSGSITVRGRSMPHSSSLTVVSDLDIGGQDGSGTVLLEEGGLINAGGVLVGDRAGTGGETVTISGVDTTGIPSKLSADDELHVAGNAQTQIEVKDGGTLSTSGRALVGEKFAVGKVIVHGKSGDDTEASWVASDNVFIGSRLVASELIVEDGGLVVGAVSKSMVLGSQTGDIGKVSVSHKDSLLNVDTLVVGADGRGELSIAGALVQSMTGIVGRSNAAGPPAPAGGPGAGLVTIDFSALPPAPGEWKVSGNCFVGVDEPGTVKLLGSKLGPLGLSAFLTVGGALTVGTPGQIIGSGRLTAPHVFNNGIISPGLSPGTIEIDGEYEQGPEGALTIEAAGLEQGQFDVLQITGNATLAGTLELRFIDGYLPKAGDSFDFLEVGGTMTGDFAQMTFPNLAPGFVADLSTTADDKLRLTALTDGVLRCAGDCDGGDTVSIDELLTMVDIALGNLSADRCLAGDTTGDEEITVDEILGALNKALSGCR